MEGMKAMVPDNRLTDVSHALEVATRQAENKFGVTLGIVEGYGGAWNWAHHARGSVPC